MASGSKIDYSGRTVDLLLLKTVLDVPAVNKRVGLDVSNVSGEPMIVSGIEKLVQRYALCFINALGSTKFRPEHGTEIVQSVGTGRVYDIHSLRVESSIADLSARSQIIAADEGEGTPEDERLVQSEVTNLKFLRDKARVEISVKLTTAAGKSYVYVVPVAIGAH